MYTSKLYMSPKTLLAWITLNVALFSKLSHIRCKNAQKKLGDVIHYTNTGYI